MPRPTVVAGGLLLLLFVGCSGAFSPTTRLAPPASSRELRALVSLSRIIPGEDDDELECLIDPSAAVERVRGTATQRIIEGASRGGALLRLDPTTSGLRTHTISPTAPLPAPGSAAENHQRRRGQEGC